MNLTISKKSLVEKLNKLKCALKNKIFLYADNGILWAEALNEEIYARVKLVENVEEKIDKITLSSHLITIITKLSGDSVLLEFQDNKIDIKSDKFQCSLNYLENDQKTWKPVEEGLLDIPNIKNYIKQVAISVAKNNSRPALTGICFSLKDNGFKIRSCDGFRLTELNINNLSGNLEFIVPAESFLKAIDSVEDDYKIYCNKSDLLLEDKDSMYLIRLIDATYPSTDKLVPTSCDYYLNIKKNEFNSALERCAILSGINEIINLSVKQNEITMTIVSEVGKIVETIEIDNSNNCDLSLNISMSFLKAAINTFDNNLLKLGLISPLKPVIITCDSSKSDIDNNLLQLILPVRVG